MKNKKALLGLLGVTILAFSMSGCMTTPGQYEYIGNKSDPVDFNGFTTRPNEYVYLYARRPGTTDWDYIGFAKTGTLPSNHFGTDWYFWSKSIVVPDEYWNTGRWSEAEVKARSVAGSDLLTFEQGFIDWFDDYDNLNDLYHDRGNGTVVTIVAN